MPDALPAGDEQQIDYTISEMLGAWQLGDIDKLHKDYADDVSVVNGIWAPPVFSVDELSRGLSSAARTDAAGAHGQVATPISNTAATSAGPAISGIFPR